MKKILPKVYANPINKTLSNNKEIYYSNEKANRTFNNINVPAKINEIFASKSHVYKSHVRITTNNEEIDTIIVGKTGNNLLTINGEKININDIENIEKM